MIANIIRAQKAMNIETNISKNFTNLFYTKIYKHNEYKGDAHESNNQKRL